MKNIQLVQVEASPSILFDPVEPGLDASGVVIYFKSLKEAKKYGYTKLFFTRLRYLAPKNVMLLRDGKSIGIYISYRLWKNFKRSTPAEIKKMARNLAIYKGEKLPPELRGAEIC